MAKRISAKCVEAKFLSACPFDAFWQNVCRSNVFQPKDAAPMFFTQFQILTE
jgi:hypothetical protein